MGEVAQEARETGIAVAAAAGSVAIGKPGSTFLDVVLSEILLNGRVELGLQKGQKQVEEIDGQGVCK